MSETRIMIVEDDRVFARSVGHMLGNLGYSVVSWVVSGEEAVARAGSINPDVILMDIALEGEMDGLEAASRIREETGVPVVYLSAFADEETLDRVQETQPFGYIPKPCSESQLHSAVEICLSLSAEEKRLRRQENLFRSITDSLPVGVALMDRDFRLVMANGVFREWFPDMQPGRRSLFFSPVGATADRRVYEPDAENSFLAETETPLGRKSFRVRATPLDEAVSGRRYVVETCEDVSEFVHAESLAR
jgi:CheY-like chemotaxis protein